MFIGLWFYGFTILWFYGFGCALRLSLYVCHSVTQWRNLHRIGKPLCECAKSHGADSYGMTSVEGTVERREGGSGRWAVLHTAS